MRFDGPQHVEAVAIITMRKLRIILLACVAAFAIWSLVSGAACLEWRLPGGLPFGNALAAAGLAGLAGIAVELSRRHSALRVASWVSLALAVAWLPVSIALAGNLELSFSGGGGSLWIGLTAGVAALALGCVVGVFVSRLWGRL